MIETALGLSQQLNAEISEIREKQITSLIGQNLADHPEFLRDFLSGAILASDDTREHMGKAKNGPDRRLACNKPATDKTDR